MENLVEQRCLNHEQREAVARCPECRQFYCRECVTEHDDRVICAGCLRKLVAGPPARRCRLSSLGVLAAALAGLFTVWLFFYLAGQVLLSIPASFHEGTFWQTTFWDE
jgi:hypothetical protein